MTDTHDTHPPRRWVILGVLALAQLMVVLDVTVVNVALPSAQAALHFGNEQRQWIVTAYTLAFGSALLLGGKIGDLVGRKRTFLGGVAGFAAASALGGAASSFGMFAAGRALQGLAGALLAPAALGLLTTSFRDPAERTRAFGVYGAIGAVGASVGLLLGGTLTELLDWRAVMFVNVVFAAIAVLGGLALLESEPRVARPRLDLRGAAAVSGGLFALVYGVSHAETTSWTNASTLVLFAAAVLLLTLFVRLQLVTEEPLLPLRIVTDRTRAAAFVSTGLASASMFGTFLFLTYYLQQNLGYSPIRTGLAFLPNSLALTLSAMFLSSRLQARYRPGLIVGAGMFISAASLLYLSRLGVHASYLTAIFPALLVWGVGLGVVFPTNVANAVTGVEPRDAGVASATVNTTQQIGGSIGTALLSTIAASAATGYLSDGALAAAAHGYTASFFTSAVLFALAGVLALLLYRTNRPARQPLKPAVALH